MAKSMNDLFELLPGLLKAFPDADEVREAVVFAVWNKAGGDVLESHSIPIELHKKHLIVAVRDGIWKRNLESMAPQLLGRLNKLLRSSEVKFIEFVVDENRFEVISSDGSNEPHRSPGISLDAGDELRRKASAIEDTSLRRNFLDAAESYLSRQMKAKQIKES